MNWKIKVAAFLLVVVAGYAWQAGWFDGSSQVLSATDSSDVDERVSSLEKRVSALERQLRPAKKGVAKETFFSIPTGSATGSGWTPVSGSEFWFDQSLYGNVTKVSWEGWLSVKDGGGSGYARLYDLTNHRAVDFSEVKITGSRASFYSSALAIWRGQNQYRVELKSTTGYEVSISEPRLKIVTQ